MLKVKISDGKYSYSEKLSSDELNESRQYYDMSDEEWMEYHKPIKIKSKELNTVNGKHFIFGFMESLGQSDSCPIFIIEAKELDITVEIIGE